MPGFGTTNTWINTRRVRNAPDGHGANVAAVGIGSYQLEERETLQFAAGTYTNANKVTAFDNLITALNTAIQALITDTWGVDDTAKDIDYDAEVIDIKRGDEVDDIFLAEANDNFHIQVIIKVTIA